MSRRFRNTAVCPVVSPPRRVCHSEQLTSLSAVKLVEVRRLEVQFRRIVDVARGIPTVRQVVRGSDKRRVVL